MTDTPDSTEQTPTTKPDGPPIVYATPPNTAPAGPIVARASTEYRLKRIALVALLFGYGLWSCYDGFVKMPRENAAAVARGLKLLPYPGYDVPFNKAFGLGLPPLALLMLGWSLYASRGEYRLGEDGVLRLPGHPPIPLTAVTSVDRGKWDRKGIAYLSYPVTGTAVGRAKLDDFVYQRQPTDWIFDRVLAAVEAPAGDPPVRT